MRLVAVMLLAGCVADVSGIELPPPNPIPPAGSEGEDAEEEGPGSQTQVTATGYLTQIAMIHCEQAFSCRSTYPNDAATFEATWKTSVTECVTNLQVAWGAGVLETEMAKGRIQYDGTAAVDCLGGVAFAACDTHWTDGIQWAQSCYSVMVGNVPTGGNCESLYSCQSFSCDTTAHVCL
jgi:hypothetical protein